MALMAPTTKQKFDNQWMKLTLFLSAISVRNAFVCCMSQSSNHSLASRIDDRWDAAILPSNGSMFFGWQAERRDTAEKEMLKVELGTERKDHASALASAAVQP